MQFIHTVEDRLLEELKDISAKHSQGEEMTAQCLDNIKDIAIALNQLTTYQAMKDSGFGGYSNDGYYNTRSGQSRDMRRSMMMGNSHDAYSDKERWRYPDEMRYNMRPEMY